MTIEPLPGFGQEIEMQNGSIDHASPCPEPARPGGGATASPGVVIHRGIEAAFLAAQMEFAEIVRDKQGSIDGRAISYSSLPNVIDTLRPCLNRHGISLRYPTRFKDVAGRAWLVVSCVLNHAASGEKLDGADWPVASGLVHQMALAAATTQARRHITLSLLGAASEDSDDEAPGAPGAGEALSSTATADPAPGDAPDLAPTPPEVAADLRAQLAGRSWVDEKLSAVTSDADLDVVLESDAWNALSRADRATFDDKVTVLREQLAAGDGKRTPPKSRRAFIAERDAAAAPPVEDRDAQLFVELSLSLQKARGKAALDAWAAGLTDEVMAKLSPLQIESLESEYRRRSGGKKRPERADDGAPARD